MPIDKITIAAAAVAVALAVFFLSFLANCVEQMRHTGLYDPPKDIVDLLKLILGAAVATLTFSGVRGVKQVKLSTPQEDKPDGEEKN